MDGNYALSSIPFSLKTISAVKVAQQALMASGVTFKDPRTEDIAKRGVRELELPHKLIEMVESLICPLRIELNTWYRRLYQCGEPIFTPLGTVDWKQSANAILLDERMCKITHYIVACDCCMEDHIYGLFSELINMRWHPRRHLDIEQMSSPWVQFWTFAFSGKFGRVTPDGHLPQRAYNAGLKLAMASHNDIAIRHFINKASPEVVSKCSYFSLYYSDVILEVESPATFCLIISKQSETDQQVSLPSNANYLLHLLMRWPYQSFCVDAARSLTGHLTEDSYWKIMITVLRKIENLARDSIYRRLFTTFWLEGSRHRHGHVPAIFYKFILEVLMFKDEALINFVLAEMCTDWKDALLLKFRDNKICLGLMHRKEFRLLKLFIRGCGANRRNVLLRFKSNLMSLFNNESLEFWGPSLDLFSEIVDGIIDEKRDAEEMMQ